MNSISHYLTFPRKRKRWNDVKIAGLYDFFFFCLEEPMMVMKSNNNNARLTIMTALLLIFRATRGLTFPQINTAALGRQGGQRIILHRSMITGNESDQPPTCHTSVTGMVYQPDKNASDSPVVTLFTKYGCTLCDTVKQVLASIREEQQHTLMAVDITDPQHSDWYDRYKYDIPVLHIDQRYWTKHRLTPTEAIQGLRAMEEGTFQSPPGEPNAAAMERPIRKTLK